MRPPDPEKLEAHLESLRGALSRCRDVAREATEDGERRILAQRLRSYRAQIRDLERDLEKLKAGDLEGTRWERRPMDELTYRALVHQAAQMEEAPDGEARIHETPGLPLLIPSVPEGLPARERERVEARARTRILAAWTDVVAERLAGADRNERHALAAIIDQPPPGTPEDQWTPDRVRWRMARRGVVLALLRLQAGERWSGRIGSGKGSAKVPQQGSEIVPADAGIVGQLQWLSQAAWATARSALMEEAREARDPRRRDLRPKDPADDEETSPEVDWERDPETGELKQYAPEYDLWTGESLHFGSPDPLDPIEATESPPDRWDDLVSAQRRKETRATLEALGDHLRDVCLEGETDEPAAEAIRRTAEERGVQVRSVERTLERVFERYEA